MISITERFYIAMHRVKFEEYSKEQAEIFAEGAYEVLMFGCKADSPELQELINCKLAWLRSLEK